MPPSWVAQKRDVLQQIADTWCSYHKASLWSFKMWYTHTIVIMWHISGLYVSLFVSRLQMPLWAYIWIKKRKRKKTMTFIAQTYLLVCLVQRSRHCRDEVDINPNYMMYFIKNVLICVSLVQSIKQKRNPPRWSPLVHRLLKDLLDGGGSWITSWCCRCQVVHHNVLCLLSAYFVLASSLSLKVG